MNDIGSVGLFTAFFAGLLSFLSPCILPLLPGYISFISGESVESLTVNNNKIVRIKAVIGSIFFGLGFSIVFVLLGASATGFGKILHEYRYIMEKIAGIIVIVFGLHLFGIFKIRFLHKQKKWNYKKRGAPFFIEAFILGVAFVFGWTPCVGPILAGVLAYAAKEETVSQGIILLSVYSLGLWIPFFISALALGYIISFIRKAGKTMWWIEKISGALLIFIGLLILTDALSVITIYLMRIFQS